jgi:hypothetical protein
MLLINHTSCKSAFFFVSLFIEIINYIHTNSLYVLSNMNKLGDELSHYTEVLLTFYLFSIVFRRFQTIVSVL